jgi:hypothetical protein
METLGFAFETPRGKNLSTIIPARAKAASKKLERSGM